MKTTKADGLWAEDDIRRAFVAGAKWWAYHQTGGFTMWMSNVILAEAVATERYGEPTKENHYNA